MRINQIVMALGLAAASVPAFAQYEGTRVDERLGHGEDSLLARQNLSMFQMHIRNNSFAEAYEPWKVVFTKAPFAQVSIYAHGAYMLGQLIAKETDQTKKQTYFNDLMGLYDTRIKNLDGLNSFTSPSKRSTEGDVLSRKAYDYATFGNGVASDYSLEKAYEMFRKGIDLIEEKGGREVEGFVLNKFFEVSSQMYAKDNVGFREQYLKDYMQSREVCEKMLEKARTTTDSTAIKKILSQYDPTLIYIEQVFAQSKAADREQIIAIFGPKIEENKTNLNYLKSALTLLAANNCDDDPIYYKAAEYAYNIEPSFESAIGTAKKYAKDGDAASSVQYYDKALELCPTNEQKAKIALLIASASAKSEDIAKAYTYLDKAQQFSPSIGGRAMLMRAQFLAAEKKFGEAISSCDQAITADVSLSGTATRLKENIIKIQQQTAKYEKDKAAYDAEVAKRKKIEEFWNGSK